MCGAEEQRTDDLPGAGGQTAVTGSERSVPPCVVIWPLWSLAWSDLGKLLPPPLPPSRPLLSADNLLPVVAGSD